MLPYKYMLLVRAIVATLYICKLRNTVVALARLMFVFSVTAARMFIYSDDTLTIVSNISVYALIAADVSN